jgi:hypothetical protein
VGVLGRIRSTLRGDAASSSKEPKFILSRQGDGLGERLNALLNAMRLATILDVDFRFTWPVGLAKDADHAIVPAEQFFSADFVEAHQVDHADTVDGFPTLDGPDDDLDSLRKQLDAADRGLRATTRPLSTKIDPVAVPVVRRGFATEFAAVGFHPDIEAAIAAAHAVPLGDGVVGLHLRAGDNLFGRYRTWTRHAYKAVPVPVARAIIERHQAEGHEVLIFGQDVELIGELCSSTGATDAAALRPTVALSRPAEAVFDLVLMSRCDPIVSGWSGFAIQAAVIADKVVDNYRDVIPAMEVIDLTKADIAANGDRYSDTHRSYAWWSAFYAARHDLSYDDAVQIVTAALDADPTNPRSRLRLAALHYRQGEVQRGNDALIDALAADSRSDKATLESVLLFSLRTKGGFDSEEIFPDIEAVAEAGPGPASLYRASLRARRGDADGAQQDLAAFTSFAADEPRLDGLDDARTTATIERELKRNGRPG